MELDATLYPDLDVVPDELNTDAEKADYLARVCAAWDFGVFPEPSTLALLAGMRAIFERFPVQNSPAYHALCERYGLAHCGSGHVFRARYEVADAIDERSDPFHGRV